jgi:hypothetical protein
MNKTTKIGLILLITSISLNILLRILGKTFLDLANVFPLGSLAHLIATGAIAVVYLLSVLLIPIGTIVLVIGLVKKAG